MIIKYFGIISDIVGKSQEKISFKGRFKNLMVFLLKKYPISKYLSDYTILLNGRKAKEKDIINEKSVVVFLPVVMGG